MKKTPSEKQQFTEAQIAFQFKPGVSGNPAGRPSRKPLALSNAYQKQLSVVDPETGRTAAELIAELIVGAAVSGDVHAIMSAVSNDSKGMVQTAIDKLVEENQCSKRQAQLALSLFLPEGIIKGK